MDRAIGLHHNGERCPACELRREEAARTFRMNTSALCNMCGGTGWLQKPDSQIVQETAQEARRSYWAARLKAFEKHNRRKACRSTA